MVSATSLILALANLFQPNNCEINNVDHAGLLYCIIFTEDEKYGPIRSRPHRVHGSVCGRGYSSSTANFGLNFQIIII